MESLEFVLLERNFFGKVLNQFTTFLNNVLFLQTFKSVGKRKAVYIITSKQIDCMTFYINYIDVQAWPYSGMCRECHLIYTVGVILKAENYEFIKKF